MAIGQSYGVVCLRQKLAVRIGNFCPIVKIVVDGINGSQFDGCIYPHKINILQDIDFDFRVGQSWHKICS